MLGSALLGRDGQLRLREGADPTPLLSTIGSPLSKYFPLGRQTPGCWKGGKMDREAGEGRGRGEEGWGQGKVLVTTTKPIVPE